MKQEVKVWKCSGCGKEFSFDDLAVSIDIGKVEIADGGDIVAPYEVFMVEEYLGHMCSECGMAVLLGIYEDKQKEALLRAKECIQQKLKTQLDEVR